MDWIKLAQDRYNAWLLWIFLLLKNKEFLDHMSHYQLVKQGPTPRRQIIVVASEALCHSCTKLSLMKWSSTFDFPLGSWRHRQRVHLDVSWLSLWTVRGENWVVTCAGSNDRFKIIAKKGFRKLDFCYFSYFSIFLSFTRIHQLSLHSYCMKSWCI
jgi:hypothetical protein